MRSTWTDSRLDDFKTSVDSRLDAIGGRIDHQSDRIDSLQHAILVVGGGMLAAFIAVLAAILGLIATQI